MGEEPLCGSDAAVEYQNCWLEGEPTYQSGESQERFMFPLSPDRCRNIRNPMKRTAAQPAIFANPMRFCRPSSFLTEQLMDQKMERYLFWLGGMRLGESREYRWVDEAGDMGEEAAWGSVWCLFPQPFNPLPAKITCRIHRYMQFFPHKTAP